MFRISQYMEEIAHPTPLGEKRNPPGPVVIWNLIRRCNLTCKHCYSISADKDFPGELTTEEIYAVMDDLKRFRVPVLILSGGEPLLRPDIFDVAQRAKGLGFYVGLSSNGTLIDESNIRRIEETDFCGSLAVFDPRMGLGMVELSPARIGGDDMPEMGGQPHRGLAAAGAAIPGSVGRRRDAGQPGEQSGRIVRAEAGVIRRLGREMILERHHPTGLQIISAACR